MASEVESQEGAEKPNEGARLRGASHDTRGIDGVQSQTKDQARHDKVLQEI